MNVLVVEPEKVPCEAEIDGSLESMQKLVGGTIEAVYPFEDHVALVCNDEGKLNGLPLNRKLEDYDIIAGTFFICGLGEDDFTSLQPDLMDKYRNKFAKAELFMRMGGHIVAIPVEPQKEQKKDRQKNLNSRDER
jgi:hypothetical protein